MYLAWDTADCTKERARLAKKALKISPCAPTPTCCLRRA